MPMPHEEDISPLYIAVHAGLLDIYPLLPPNLTSCDADPEAVIACLHKKERAVRRSANRGDIEVPPLHATLALPAEAVEVFVLLHTHKCR